MVLEVARVELRQIGVEVAPAGDPDLSPFAFSVNTARWVSIAPFARLSVVVTTIFSFFW